MKAEHETRHGDVSEEVDAKAVTRRTALKKAAAAAGVAGAVWSAPRIEGLSIVPDYALAGTFMGTVTFNKQQRDCAPGNSGNCWGNCNASDSCSPIAFTVPVYAPFSGMSGGVGPGGPRPGNFMSTTPGGPFPTNQNEFITVDYSGKADTGVGGPGLGRAHFNFTMMDPPFNMANVTMAHWKTDFDGGFFHDTQNFDSNFPGGNDPRLNIANHNMNPSRTDSADVVFGVPVGVHQSNDVTIIVTCT